MQSYIVVGFGGFVYLLGGRLVCLFVFILECRFESLLKGPAGLEINQKFIFFLKNC